MEKIKNIQDSKNLKLIFLLYSNLLRVARFQRLSLISLLLQIQLENSTRWLEMNDKCLRIVSDTRHHFLLLHINSASLLNCRLVVFTFLVEQHTKLFLNIAISRLAGAKERHTRTTLLYYAKFIRLAVMYD